MFWTEYQKVLGLFLLFALHLVCISLWIYRFPLVQFNIIEHGIIFLFFLKLLLTPLFFFLYRYGFSKGRVLRISECAKTLEQRIELGSSSVIVMPVFKKKKKNTNKTNSMWHPVNVFLFENLLTVWNSKPSGWNVIKEKSLNMRRCSVVLNASI